MGWDELRKRNEAVEARIVAHPVAAWAIHALLFVGVALLAALPDIGPADWAYALTAPPIIALAPVGGALWKHRRRQRSQQRR